MSYPIYSGRVCQDAAPNQKGEYSNYTEICIKQNSTDISRRLFKISIELTGLDISNICDQIKAAEERGRATQAKEIRETFKQVLML